MEVTIWRYRTSGKKIIWRYRTSAKKIIWRYPNINALVIFWEFLVKIVTKGRGQKKKEISIFGLDPHPLLKMEK